MGGGFLKKQGTSLGFSKWDYFYIEAYSRTVMVIYKMVILENEIIKLSPQGLEYL